jgi:hypothetical protein
MSCVLASQVRKPQRYLQPLTKRIRRQHHSVMNGFAFGTLSLATATAVGAASFMDARKKVALPVITMIQNEFNKRVMSLCPSLNAPYKPVPFLTNGHVETIFAAWFRRLPNLKYRRECITRPDNGTVALDWCMQAEVSTTALNSQQKLHALNIRSSKSTYQYWVVGQLQEPGLFHSDVMFSLSPPPTIPWWHVQRWRQGHQASTDHPHHGLLCHFQTAVAPSFKHECGFSSCLPL